MDAAVWAALEREAAGEGVGIAEYLRDAALARVAFARRAREEGPDDLLATWARTLLEADEPRVFADVTQERFEEAVALRAESRQARRQSELVQAEGSAILDAAVRIMTDVLEHRGIALAAPVMARFRTTDEASTGIEVDVRLDEPDQAEVARAAIEEHIGDVSPVDVIHVR
jgi:hypothetical protein